MDIFSKGVVGKFNFKIDDIDFSNPLFLEGNEYFPISSLLGNKYVWFKKLSFHISYTSKERKIADTLMNKLPGVGRIFKTADTIGNHARLSLDNLFNMLSDDISDYIKASPNISYSMSTRSYSRTSYVRIADSFFDTKFTTYYLQSMRILCAGAGTIIHSSSNSLLMGIVFDAKLLKYHRLYFLIHGKFDYANMEFWINCDIDTPQYPHKGFRKMYRGMIKPKLLKLGIEIVEKGDVDASLRASFSVPQNSISELIEWKHDLLTDFIKKEADEMIFEFK